MDDQQQSRSRPTRKQILWAVGILAVIVGACIFLRFAYVREWKWTGLVKNPDFHERTLWDWLNLLIVPAVLALGGYLFTRSENRRTREEADQQRRLDREIADDRRQDDTLQAYLDGMSQLLTDEKRPLYRAQPGDHLSTVARARTLTVLPRLTGNRKARVLQFLLESELIYKEHTLLDESGLMERRHNIVSLKQADLSRANLREADLSRPIWRDVYPSRADLREAHLSGADLRGANLSGALLSGADMNNEQLEEQTKSLADATMPNGQKYEDWLKSKGRGEDGENSAPS